MGCDIHMHVEYKNTGRGDAIWRCGDYFKVDNPLSEAPTLKRIGLYEGRNYSLFAVLADVRNYNLMDYVAEPKGLPDDVTDFVKREYQAWGSDAHSCSYFTLQELIDFYDEHKPVDPLGYDILKPIINKLKQRADELDLIWDFEWDNSFTRDVAYKKADNIRIVFWFDN